MKTRNRQAASDAPAEASAPTVGHLAELRREIRRLWARDLRVAPEEREALLVELTEVDLAIERLSIRASTDIQLSDDALIAARCAQQIEDLQRRWEPDLTLDHSSEGLAA